MHLYQFVHCIQMASKYIHPQGVKSDLKGKCMQFVTARLYRRQGNIERQCEDNASSN